MSWTWDKEVEGELEEYNVSSFFNMSKRIVYSRPDWTFDQKQHMYIYFNNANLQLNFQFLFDGTIKSWHPRYYFNKLNYIEGTYIRKDRFAEMLEKKHHEIVLDLNLIPLTITDDWVKQWLRLIKEVGIMFINSTGIPEKYEQKEIREIHRDNKGIL